MKIQRQSAVLRAHLFKMAMLAHRAVDYATKAYELGNPEFCELIRYSDEQWREVQCAIGDRGRRLLTAGLQVDSDSLFARCTMRIYSALRVTHTAASEIAHNSMLITESGQLDRSEPIRQMGGFVNGLVRVCTVALFKREVLHAEAILYNDQGREWFERTLNLAHDDLLQQAGTRARFELAVIRSLNQIAEQSYEIAEAFTCWIGGEDGRGVPRELAA
jgi:phosphate uptake regulator